LPEIPAPRGGVAHSLGLAIEDRRQIIQRLIDPPEVTHVAPVDGVRVVAEVVVGQLP
jgi:hypothetical protein